jgi:hypothetical protein
MVIRLTSIAAAALAGLALAGPAYAQQSKQTPDASERQERAPAFANARRTDEATLGKATAREDLSQIAQSQQTSTVSNNSVNGTSTTGDITITGNALENANGLTIINANSGNNVGMNAAINVNIVMTPPQQ